MAEKKSKYFRRRSQKNQKPDSADHAQIETTKLPTPNPMVSKFIQIVPDDLLLQIFLRLPNGRCVVQLAAICKRWHSLIINPHTEKLASDFVQYHSRKQSLDSSYSPANTAAILLHYAEHTDERCHRISSETRLSKPFSCECGGTVRASCGDFLLLSHGIRQYSIYNPRTRQLIIVPDLTNDDPQFIDRILRGFVGYGLVLREAKNGTASYRIVIIIDSSVGLDHWLCSCFMFCSETQLWTLKISRVPYRFPYRGLWRVFPRIAPEVALTRDGVLYWLVVVETPTRLACILSFDPFRSEFGLVPNIPNGLNLQVGVVRGQLWLSQMVWINTNRSFILRVWELDKEEDELWRLVHDVELGKWWIVYELRVLAFDPMDGNVVYLMREGRAFRYEIGDGKCEKVCGFPYYRNGYKIKRINNLIAGQLRAITLVHSLWPLRLQIT